MSGWQIKLIVAGLLAAMLHAPASGQTDREDGARRFWNDAWRGWHFYEEPATDETSPAPPAPKVSPPPPRPAQRPPELLELERLRQAVEDLRGIAVMRPTEENVRRYMELEAKVVAKASTFADIAQRLAWTSPELDPSLQGRPVNARALEVFELQQASQRSRTASDLARDHVLLFFFRSDCPYCHAMAPMLEALQARHGLRVEAVSLDGGGLPGFANARRDNGAAAALRVAQVPALFLAQPFTGRIVPIGFGVLSEAQVLERIAVAASPAFEAQIPGAVRRIALP